MVVPRENPLAIGQPEALRAQVAADGEQAVVFREVWRREDQAVVEAENSHSNTKSSAT